MDDVRFWLERGVDGFRLDVFNAYFKNPAFRDNPPRLGLRGFDRQRHIYDIDQPEMLPFLTELRSLLDRTRTGTRSAKHFSRIPRRPPATAGRAGCMGRSTLT